MTKRKQSKEKSKEQVSPERSKQKMKRLNKKSAGIEIINLSVEQPKQPTPQKQKSPKKIKPQKIEIESNSEMSDEEFQKMVQEEMQQKNKSKPSSKNNQKKPTPQKSNKIPLKNSQKPFEGQKFVLTGVFKSANDRNDIAEVIIDLGGKVTTQVSGVTNYLLHGYKLEDEREPQTSNKYKRALEKKTKILSEDDFSQLLEKETGKNLIEHLGKTLLQETEKDINYKKSFFQQKKVKNQKVDLEEMLQEKQKDTRLWTEIFKPTKLDQILGNEDIVQKLYYWLKNWNSLDKSNKSRQKEDSKAVLLSGPPGIGKTTAAMIVTKALGFDFILQNASDQRNKQQVDNYLSNFRDNKLLTNYFQDIEENTKEKCVIIMDEVDGMTGDRGGIAALVQQIKTTNRPIICICNDRDKQTIKTLATYCYDLKFKPPTTKDIMKLIDVIISKQISPDTWNLLDKSLIMNIISSCQNDIRQIINYLEMWFKDFDISNPIQNKNISEVSSITNKDVLNFLTPFEASKKLLNSKLTYQTDYKILKNYFFVDYNLMDLFIFENYLPKQQQTNKSLELKKIDLCLDSMMKGDQINKNLKEIQDYSLLNTFGYFSCIRPSLLLTRILDFPQFPQYLGKFSSRRKKQRLVKELMNAYSTSMNMMQIQSVVDTSETLSIIIGQLMKQNKFEDLYNLYQEYDLNPILIKENFQIILDFYGSSKSLDEISAKEKNSFQKFYNQKYSKKVEITKKGKDSKNDKKTDKKGTKTKKSKKRTKSKTESEAEVEEIEESDLEDFIVPDEYYQINLKLIRYMEILINEALTIEKKCKLKSCKSFFKSKSQKFNWMLRRNYYSLRSGNLSRVIDFCKK